MKWYGQNEFDRYLFERYYAGSQWVERHGTIVECGALDGLELSNGLAFEQQLGWKTINIEPAQRAFEALQVNRPKALNLRLALDFREGQAMFWDAVHPLHGHLSGNGSLDHTAEHREQLEAEGYTFDSYPVVTMRYSALMHILGQPPVDLMILDVEGAELRVLDGMQDAQSLPRVLAIEADHISVEKLVPAAARMRYVLDSKHHDNAVFVRMEGA